MARTLGEEMSLLVEVSWMRAERLRGKAGEWLPLPPVVTISAGLWPDALKRALREAELMRSEDGRVGVWCCCSGDCDAARVGRGPVEGFDVGGVVDGEDCGDTCLSECAKARAGVGRAISGGDTGVAPVEEDSDLALDVEVGWRHAVADEDERRFNK